MISSKSYLDGIVIDSSDFIYVAGDFNFWSPTAEYAMKKDSNSERFWIEIEGLESGEIYTYQYWVSDLSPIDESPS